MSLEVFGVPLKLNQHFSMAPNVFNGIFNNQYFSSEASFKEELGAQLVSTHLSISIENHAETKQNFLDDRSMSYLYRY